MKKNAILLFLLLPLHTALATQRADSLLRALDQAIDNSRLYTQQKEMRIGKVKQMLQVPHLTPAQRYDINARLAQEYKSFMLDSAIRYTRQNVRIARASGTKEQYYASTLDLARLYSITNLFVEAADLLRGISPGELSTPLRIQYYETYRAFYNYYSMSDERDATHYHAIRDTLMHLYRPEENGYKILLAEQLQTAGRHREAQQVLTGLLAQARQEDGWRAVAAYLAGDAYARTQDYERQIEYFAQSAIADVKNAIKENMSLRALAMALYHEGQIERAYRYIQKSMEDAIFCNAHLRSMEISQIFPIIDKAQQARNEQQRQNMRTLNVCILLLSVGLVVALVSVYRQMGRLSRAKQARDKLYRDLQTANRDLQRVNRELQESNTLKEEYVARYMNEASGYLDKLEEYRHQLNRIAMTGKVEDLYKALKSTRQIEEEVDRFYANFDRSFLQLFPRFIDEFNALLREEERIVPRQKELLNTELRIFALIRLGITDSNMIAHFLRYPVRTIYNYRARIRNKAAGNRDKLEDDVMAIGMRD